jgi:hypothetical protein
MLKVVLIAACAALLGAVAVAGEDDVPKTYEGSGDAFREGGEELGEGFRSLGRGIQKTFKGEAAKKEYENTEKIGEGFKDVGRGVAGGGRATGRGLQKGFEQNEPEGEGPEPLRQRQPQLEEGRSSTVTEEPLQ